jgi:hypothetical protein
MAYENPGHDGNYDLFLDYDGETLGIILHRDENGNVSWFPGLAPALQQQFQTGDWGYELTPSEVDIPFSWQDFSGGAGFQDDPNGGPGPGPRRYSYSRGIDASEGTRITLSPLQVADSGIAAAPVKYIETSLGTYAIAGRFIYELTTAPGTWTERNDAGAGKAWTDIIEYKGSLFAAQANDGSYEYSADGTTWAAYTDEVINAFYFATRGDVLWAVLSNNTMRNNASGTAKDGGTAWTAADNVGHSGETVRGLKEIDNSLYVFKEEGIYEYTGTSDEDVWLGGMENRRTTNGFMPFVWFDQKTYVPYGDRLIQFDHLQPRIIPIFPTDAMKGHPEINGQIAAIDGDNRWLYVTIQNHNGDYYVLKGNPYHNNGEGEWHTYLYLGAVASAASIVIGKGAANPSTTNPALVLGLAAAGGHYILPRVGWRAEDDANVAFDTAGGLLFGSNTGFGGLAFSKFLNAGSVTALNLSATETARLSYEVEDNGAQVAVVTGTETGTTRAQVTGDIEFQRIRPVIRLLTGASTTGPVFIAAVLHATPNPPRRHSMTFLMDVADNLEMRGGGQSSYSARAIEAFMFGAVTKRARLTDGDGRTFIVKVNTVAGISAGQSGVGAEG